MSSCLPTGAPACTHGMRHVQSAFRRCSTPLLAPSTRHRMHTGVLRAVEHLKPHDHGASPFAELGIQEIWDGIGKTRVRQHVNPLRSGYQVPTGPLDYQSMFADPTRPLVVDIGCGPGRFLLLMHHRHSRQQQQQQQQQQQHHQPQQQQASSSNSSSGSRSSSGSNSSSKSNSYEQGLLGSRSRVSRPMNYLGLEIRQPYVERARTWAERLGCSQDVQFVFTNATISMATMLSSYPGPVQLVCLQFPDPHFKRRNHKRRIFQPTLVKDVANILEQGGCVFLQSDVEPVSVAMRNVFEHEGSDYFQLAPEHNDPDAVFFSAPSPSADDASVAQEQAGTSSTNGSGANASDVNGNGASDTFGNAYAGHMPQSSSQSRSLQEGQRGSGQTPTSSSSSSSSSSSGSDLGDAGSRSGELASNLQEPQEEVQGSWHSSHEGMSSSDEEEDDGGQPGQHEVDQQQRGGPPVVKRRRGREDVDWERVESRWAAWGWLRHNPIGVPTEREHYCMQQQLPVYRVLLEKK